MILMFLLDGVGVDEHELEEGVFVVDDAEN